MIGVATQVLSPPGLGDASASLFPASPAATPVLVGVLLEGRLPNPARADEVVVDENTRDRFHLDIGSRMIVAQSSGSAGPVPAKFLPPAGITSFRQPIRVVGIAKSVSSDPSWIPSSGFFAKYGAHMPPLVNMFVDLRNGDAAIPHLNDEVAKIVGHPVNIEDARTTCSRSARRRT